MVHTYAARKAASGLFGQPCQDPAVTPNEEAFDGGR
jgi:hypothetical protein